MKLDLYTIFDAILSPWIELMAPASVDYCEEEYAVLPFIAEFWNTISNFSFLIFGLLGLYLKQRYADFLFEEKNFNIILFDFCQMFVGSGSMLFHSTMVILMQLVDVSSMIWIVIVGCLVLIDLSSMGSLAESITKNIVILLGICWNISLFWTHQTKPIILWITYGIVLLLCIIKLLSLFVNVKDPSKGLRKTLYLSIMSILIGFGFWLSDRYFCDFYESASRKYELFIYFGSFHGYWHIFMAYSTFCLSTCLGFMLGKKSRKEVSIKWMGICPYVSI